MAGSSVRVCWSNRSRSAAESGGVCRAHAPRVNRHRARERCALRLVNAVTSAHLLPIALITLFEDGSVFVDAEVLHLQFGPDVRELELTVAHDGPKDRLFALLIRPPDVRRRDNNLGTISASARRNTRFRLGAPGTGGVQLRVAERWRAGGGATYGPPTLASANDFEHSVTQPATNSCRLCNADTQAA